MNLLNAPLAQFLVVVSLATTTGCGALMTYEANRVVYSAPVGKNDVTEKLFEDDRFLTELADRYGIMALFAETVYRGELDEKSRDELGCEYLKPDWKGDVQHGMPKIPRSASGWERWIPSGPGESPCMNAKNGLYYETYVYRDEQATIQEAVIAFRGTENREGQGASDWRSNLSAALGIEPSQYRTARDHIPGLIARLKAPSEGNPQVKIYAVGHSLGGGLAQQAGYLSRDIKEVFTFNTSPVTNWTHLRRKGLVEQGYPIIHRIYHGGEALEAPRFVATSATSARFGRHDVGVQFGARKFAEGHSMKILACNFGRILSKNKISSGAHYYPSAYINLHVLKEEQDLVGARAKSDSSSGRICDAKPSSKNNKP